MSTLTAGQARLRAQIAANERWAREPDRAAATEKMRAGRWRRYIERARELAPGATEAEVTRRAESLRQADMQRMALASARARRSASGVAS